MAAMGIVAWPGDPERANTFTCCFCNTKTVWHEGTVTLSDTLGQGFACKHHFTADRLFAAIFANYLVQIYQQDCMRMISAEYGEGNYEQNLC